METIKKQIVFSNELVKQIKLIKQKNGFLSFSEALRFCISYTYKREFKDYVVNSGAIKITKDNISDKAKAIGRNICKDLNGDMEVNDNGKELCVYWKYSKKNRYKQRVLIEDLTDTLVDNQYFPKRELVEDLQEKGKVNY